MNQNLKKEDSELCSCSLFLSKNYFFSTFFLSVTGETCFCTYSGIEKQAAVYYNTEESHILWFPNSFLMMYVFASFPVYFYFFYSIE